VNEMYEEVLKIFKTSKIKVNLITATLWHNTKYEHGRDKKPKCYMFTNYAIIVTVIIVFLLSLLWWDNTISLCKSGF